MAFFYEYLVSPGNGEVFREWRRQNYSQIVDYVRETPAARLKKKRWQDPLKKRLLTYAAILHTEAAEILLAELNNSHLGPGEPYRDTAAAAGIVYHDICFRREIDVWPFDGAD